MFVLRTKKPERWIPVLSTLRDAALYIKKLPTAEHDAAEWQAATALRLPPKVEQLRLIHQAGAKFTSQRLYVTRFQNLVSSLANSAIDRGGRLLKPLALKERSAARQAGVDALRLQLSNPKLTREYVKTYRDERNRIEAKARRGRSTLERELARLRLKFNVPLAR